MTSSEYYDHPDSLYKGRILVPKDTKSVMSHDDHQIYERNINGWSITLLYVMNELSFEEYTNKYCLKKYINGEWIYVYQEDMLLDRIKSSNIESDDDNTDWSLLP